MSTFEIYHFIVIVVPFAYLKTVKMFLFALEKKYKRFYIICKRKEGRKPTFFSFDLVFKDFFILLFCKPCWTSRSSISVRQFLQRL